MFMSSSLFAPTRASVVTTAVQGMFSFGANGSDQIRAVKWDVLCNAVAATDLQPAGVC